MILQFLYLSLNILLNIQQIYMIHEFFMFNEVLGVQEFWGSPCHSAGKRMPNVLIGGSWCYLDVAFMIQAAPATTQYTRLCTSCREMFPTLNIKLWQKDSTRTTTHQKWMKNIQNPKSQQPQQTWQDICATYCEVFIG